MTNPRLVPRRRNPPLYDVGVTGSAMPDLLFPIYMGRIATSHETATSIATSFPFFGCVNHYSLNQGFM